VTEIRPLTDADLPDLRRMDGWAFGHASSDQRWEVASAMLERHRQLGAFSAGELVGHAAAFTEQLTVPGGGVPAAGVTWVGVSPAFRRRGAMSTLMARQLGDLGEHGEPVAALWASEPGIYGRFGYGIASRRASVDVPRPINLTGLATQGWTARLADAADELDACAQVYERVRPEVPGTLSRSPEAWREAAFDEPDGRGSKSPLRCALVADGRGRTGGYVWFRTDPRWDAGDPAGRVEVSEIVATTPEATRALLDVVLDLDLMSSTHLWNLPIDHPLFTWTSHSRRLRPRIDDQLWVRLVRLDEALTSRTYATPLDVVMVVTDEACPWNAGTWRLSADETGAEVTRSTDPPDLTLDAGDLAAAYLGDDALHPALAAGVVTEHSAGAGRALARAMRGDRAPWCPYMF
jgi:predicted acetyltransferase